MPLDHADEAQELTEAHIERSLARRPKLVLPFSGRCLCCDEPVQERRYCDSDCREAHEQEMVRKSRL